MTEAEAVAALRAITDEVRALAESVFETDREPAQVPHGGDPASWAAA